MLEEAFACGAGQALEPRFPDLFLPRLRIRPPSEPFLEFIDSEDRRPRRERLQRLLSVFPAERPELAHDVDVCLTPVHGSQTAQALHQAAQLVHRIVDVRARRHCRRRCPNLRGHCAGDGWRQEIARDFDLERAMARQRRFVVCSANAKQAEIGPRGRQFDLIAMARENVRTPGLVHAQNVARRVEQPVVAE